MKLEQIRQILEIYHAGSVSRAAKNLYISQPALSKTLRMAEHELGHRIFERGHDGVRLTDFGRVYVEHANDALDNLHMIETLARNYTDSSSRTFRVTASGLRMVGHYFSQVMARYHQGLNRVSYHQTSRSRTYGDVLGRNTDLGVITIPAPCAEEWTLAAESAGVVYRPLGRFPAILAVSSANPLFHKEGDRLTPEDMAGQTLCMENEQVHFFRTMDALVRENTGVGSVAYLDYILLNYDMRNHSLEDLVCIPDVNALYAKVNMAILDRKNTRFFEVPITPFHFEYGYIRLRDLPLNEPCAALIEALEGFFAG